MTRSVLPSPVLLALAVWGGSACRQFDGLVPAPQTGSVDAGLPNAGLSDAGHPDAGPIPITCTEEDSLPILGDYVHADGSNHWLRTSVTATTYSVVPAGAPAPSRPPRLFQVTKVCPAQKLFIAVSEAGTFARYDWATSGSSLFLCQRVKDAAEMSATLTPPRADDSALRTTGCGGSAWTELVSESAGGAP